MLIMPVISDHAKMYSYWLLLEVAITLTRATLCRYISRLIIFIDDLQSKYNNEANNVHSRVETCQAMQRVANGRLLNLQQNKI